MSGISYSGSGTNQEIDDQSLPGYVPYLSLVFRIITTTIILLLSGWVVYTIKTTTSLHKPHNIFVANLLVSGMIATLVYSLIVCTMMISYQLGVESITSCATNRFMVFPVQVNRMSFVIIAADKVLAITSPYKHRRWMKPRAVAAIAIGSWLLAVFPAILSITATVQEDIFITVPEYGACILVEDVHTNYLISLAVPATAQSILTISLNIYLAKIAIQVRKQIEKETRLSGESERKTALKKKQRKIRQNMKPIITLLVVSLANILGFLLVVAVFFLYQEVLQYVIISNGIHLVYLVNPITYGLYFREIRNPMMKSLKRFTRMSKVNAITPQPRRTAWM